METKLLGLNPVFCARTGAATPTCNAVAAVCDRQVRLRWICRTVLLHPGLGKTDGVRRTPLQKLWPGACHSGRGTKPWPTWKSCLQPNRKRCWSTALQKLLLQSFTVETQRVGRARSPLRAGVGCADPASQARILPSAPLRARLRRATLLVEKSP